MYPEKECISGFFLSLFCRRDFGLRPTKQRAKIAKAAKGLHQGGRLRFGRLFRVRPEHGVKQRNRPAGH